MKRMILAVVVLAASLLLVGTVFASGGTKVCVPEKEGKSLLTPTKGACKKSYTLSELGAEGKEGKEGAAGSARDVGIVYPGTTPHYESYGLRGWLAVTYKSTGKYCLTPDATATLENSALVLSAGGSGGGSLGFILWEGYCSLQPVEYEVLTYNVKDELSNDIEFTAVVP